MTGPLILKDNPAEDLEAATKQYVDNHTSDVVLYTPQTLSDEQKVQARGNINSAPDGFGLGSVSVAFSDANDCIINGWYRDPDGNAKNTPWKWTHILVTTFLPNTYVRQDAYITGGPASVPAVNHAVRIKHPDFPEENAFWGPWEYESGIPMQLGVEYRTTERYLGKPVYCQVIDCGVITTDTQKIVDKSIPVLDVLSCEGIIHTNSNGHNQATPFDYSDTNGTKYSVTVSAEAYKQSEVDRLSIYVNSSWTVTGSVYAIVRYTKETDQ